jgi:Tripartite tricarboxylate transporter TctB family
MALPIRTLKEPEVAVAKLMTPERLRPIMLGRKADWILMAILFFVLIIYIAIVQHLTWRATAFPWFITFSMLLVLGLYALSKWRKPSVWDEIYDPEHESMQADGDTGPDYLMQNAKGVKRSLIGFLAITALTMLLGPVYAIPLFVGGYLYLQGENKIFAAVSLVALWLVMHYGFAGAMHINLPAGFLIDLFT